MLQELNDELGNCCEGQPTFDCGMSWNAHKIETKLRVEVNFSFVSWEICFQALHRSANSALCSAGDLFDRISRHSWGIAQSQCSSEFELPEPCAVSNVSQKTFSKNFSNDALVYCIASDWTMTPESGRFAIVRTFWTLRTERFSRSNGFRIVRYWRYFCHAKFPWNQFASGREDFY